MNRTRTGIQYTPLTKKAMRICFEAHQAQRDQGGMPYVFHPFHLAEQMETEVEICTALLHDVVEDSGITFEDLRREGFPPEVLEALRLLTHAEGVPYGEYVAAIRRNPVARRVKMADLLHNSDAGRLETITEKDEKRMLKYREALALLMQGDPEEDA